MKKENMEKLDNWASIEDFATLFQYFWHHDFPMDAKMAIGAGRVDWTIHIGVVVRKIAELMGLVTRFEAGGRTDAMLRSTVGDEIAVEWEWGGVLGKANELCKLEGHGVWSKQEDSERLLKYAVLITYTHRENIQRVYERVIEKWGGAQWPLLLILIDLNKVSKSKFTMRKEFNNIQMSVFSNGEKVERKELRKVPAFPWDVYNTTWTYRLKNE
jgi:hypothetical protein